MAARRTLPLVALALTLALAAPAPAATLRTNLGCYPDPRDAGQDVRVGMSGTGFQPGAVFQVLLDGHPLAGGTSRTNAAGEVEGTFSAPAVATGHEDRHRLTVQEGANTATAIFRVTRVTAGFSPSTGNPRTLRVRFGAYGFGLQRPRSTVYVHYVDPRGRVRTSRRLGRVRGACGHLRTSRRLLFPFRPRRGRWRLQFDTHRRYVRGTSQSRFVWAVVPVRIR